MSAKNKKVKKAIKIKTLHIGGTVLHSSNQTHFMKDFALYCIQVSYVFQGTLKGFQISNFEY